MIEETHHQTEESVQRMVFPPIQQNLQLNATSLNDKSVRKNGGGSMQLDSEKNCKNGYSRSLNKRSVKNYKQVHKREPGFTKNNKKSVLVDSRISRNYEDNSVEEKDIHSLINFQYVPVSRQFINVSHSYFGGRRKRTTTFNKEAFLQANCHFVVDESKKYSVNTIDPDVLVDWEDIELVYLPSHDAPSCPICLYPPVASKITRCGHVFCWSCMLHYLKLGDKSWSKCPICHEAVHANDLKSVEICVRKKYARLDKITMKLMRRPKDSLFAVPVMEWSGEASGGFPLWEDGQIQSGYKLARASKKMVLEKIFRREQTEMEVQLIEAIADQTGEECFIQSALDLLKAKVTRVSNSLDEYAAPLTGVVNPPNQPIEPGKGYLSKPPDGLQVSCKNPLAHDEENDAEITKEAIDIILNTHQASKELTCDADVEQQMLNVPRARLTSRLSESSTGSGEHSEQCCRSPLDKQVNRDTTSYYFYQATDGQNIFVNSLNARCLIEEYGSLADGPLEITGQIIDFECFTMTKELRKRFRYLSYLPISCEFVIVELLLRPPVLSKHTIHNFMGEFKKRKDDRAKKLEKQKKFDRRAAALRNEQEGYAFADDEDDEDKVVLNLTDVVDFPQHLSPEMSDNLNLIATASNASNESNSAHARSFAQILSTQSAVTPMERTSVAWGKPKIEENVIRPPKLPNGGDESDEGPDLIAPSLKEMFSTAMITGQIQMKTSTSTQSEKIKGGSSKKKKNKGTLLFATGGQRKY